MKTVTATAFSLFATMASAHPGHGSWFHSHQDELIEVAMIAVACLIAALVVRLMWKVLEAIPGEVRAAKGEIELNKGRATVTVEVTNTGDRPVQVGSHYHFFETNDALAFDRAKAYGFRLDIAAGTAVRFEPGQKRTVKLVALAGDRKVYGFQGKVMGPLKTNK